MKHILSIFAIIVTVALTSCGVGSYSVESGKEDTAEIVITDRTNHSVIVKVDGEEFDVMTVKNKEWKKDRKIKKTAKRAINVSTGQHEVEVINDDQTVYKQKVFLSTGETRIISIWKK